MKRSHVSALAGLFAIAAAVAYGVWKNEAPMAPQRSPLKAVSNEVIERIQIVAGSTITAVHVGEDWKLTSPLTDAGDRGTMNRLIDGLRNYALGSVVSENPIRLPQFALDPAQAARVSVFLKGETTPVLDLYVGKPTADLESSFVRYTNETAVHTADGLSSFLVRDDVSRFRDTSVNPFRYEDLTAFAFKDKDGGATFTRSGKAWKTQSGRSLGDGQTTFFRTRLRDLKATDFAPHAPIKDVAAELDFTRGTSRVHVIIGNRNLPGTDTRPVFVEGRPSDLVVPADAVKGFLYVLGSLH